jgi:hypothetical protein
MRLADWLDDACQNERIRGIQGPPFHLKAARRGVVYEAPCPVLPSVALQPAMSAGTTSSAVVSTSVSGRRIATVIDSADM